jgi:phosphoribosyl-ATP pyrophosphohydrolase
MRTNESLSPTSNDILKDLARVLEARKAANPDRSYVASLYAGGVDRILKKIGEESTETVIAAMSGDSSEVVHEMADLWFHCLVLLTHMGLGPDDLLNELARRSGVSGLDEKSSRGERERPAT